MGWRWYARQELSAGGDHGRTVQRRAPPPDAIPRRQGGADPAGAARHGHGDEAIELAETHGWFLTRQFENEANPDFHSRTTAREIIDDFKGEKLDYWVTGYGTGGTLKGVARVLAKEMPDTKIIVCEPEDAQLLGSGAEQARNPDGSPATAHPAFKPHPCRAGRPTSFPRSPATRWR